MLCNKKVLPVLLKSSCAAVIEETSVCSLSLTLGNMASLYLCLSAFPVPQACYWHLKCLQEMSPWHGPGLGTACGLYLWKFVQAKAMPRTVGWMVQMTWTRAWLCALDQPYLLVKARLTHKPHKTKHWSSFPETLKAWDKCFCSSNVFNRIISLQQFKHVAPISAGLQRWHSTGLESKICFFTKIMQGQNLKILCLHSS